MLGLAAPYTEHYKWKPIMMALVHKSLSWLLHIRSLSSLPPWFFFFDCFCLFAVATKANLILCCQIDCLIVASHSLLSLTCWLAIHLPMSPLVRVCCLCTQKNNSPIYFFWILRRLEYLGLYCWILVFVAVLCHCLSTGYFNYYRCSLWHHHEQLEQSSQEQVPSVSVPKCVLSRGE